MNARGVAELIAHLGRVAYCEGAVCGLTSAQWAALRYFSRANRFSRTVSAFADFHSTTRGTASQTVKSLVEKGLLVRTPSERDGRSSRLDLTEEGQHALAEDPFETLVGAAAKLSAGTRGSIAGGLEHMMEDLARVRGKRPFGACTACAFLRTDHRRVGSPAGFKCMLVGEALIPCDLGKLCVNFLSASAEDGRAGHGSGHERGESPYEGVPIP